MDRQAEIATIDAVYVRARLEEAGATLLSLPTHRYLTRLRLSALAIARDMAEAPREASGCHDPTPIPSTAAISRMDQALGWVQLIPDDRPILRRIVGARSLVHPLTGQHVFAWRRLAAALATDHKAVQRWHAQGIGLIVAGLNAAGRCGGVRA